MNKQSEFALHIEEYNLHQRNDIVVMSVLCDFDDTGISNYWLDYWSDLSDGFIGVADGGICHHPIYKQFAWDVNYPYGGYGSPYLHLTSEGRVWFNFQLEGNPWYAYLEGLGYTPIQLGDFNEDGVVDILDLTGMVDIWLAFASLCAHHPPGEESECINEWLMNYYPQYDLNSDGIVNILDFVILVNIILAGGQSRQQVQKQLDRLNSVLSLNETEELHRQLDRLQPTSQLPDNEKERLIKEILRRQRNG